MRIQKPILLGAVISALVLGGVVLFATRHSQLAIRHATHKVMYYCPMHPTYTSDRPGDCPICNMKLVKKEPESSTQHTAHSTQRKPQTAKDICYMHNCPMMKPGQQCPMMVVAKAGEKVTCPICGTHVAEAASAPGSKKILYWTDPMIPGYKAAGPGKSPMGMDLVPVYEEELGVSSSVQEASTPEGYAPVLLTPQKQQLIGVKTARAIRRRITKTIRAVGTIAHDPELYQAQAEYIQATHGLLQAKQGSSADIVAQAERLVESTRVRLKHLGLSDELIQEIEMWNEPEHTLLFAHPGDPVWMYAQVYEYELPFIRTGQEVTVEVTTLPGQPFHGIIRAIDQMVDPMTRTTRIRAKLEDPQGQLKPDMYVNAAVVVDLGEVLAVPDEAVFATGERSILFVDQGQGLFEPRDVVVGVKADGYVEIKRGVSEGEAVVTSGNFLIDSESRLKGALEGMAPSPAAPTEGGAAPSGADPSGERAGGEVGGGSHQHGP